jgi:hypothetical protein
MFVTLTSCNHSIFQKNSIAVQDYRSQQTPPIDLKSHKNGDVEIWRTFFMGDSFELIYFHDYSGKLHDYHAFVGVPENFKKATYQWKNDTTVIFKFIESKPRQKMTVEVFGNGSASGMKVED